MKFKEVGKDKIKFTYEEEFRGRLVPLFSKNLDKRTKKSFGEMNKALKKLAE